MQIFTTNYLDWKKNNLINVFYNIDFSYLCKKLFKKGSKYCYFNYTIFVCLVLDYFQEI